MKQKKKSAYRLGIGHCAMYEWEIWVGWLDRPKHQSHCPSAGAGGHGGLVAGARVVAIMPCKCMHACMLVLGSSLSHHALVLGSSPSYHASACVLTAALYAEARSEERRVGKEC